MRITQRPYKFCFSKNPIQYTFSEVNYNDAGCFVQIRIYTRDIGGLNEVLLYEESIKPLSDVFFYDISTIVESALGYSLPDFSGDEIQPGSNIKEFYVQFCTITDAAPTATYISDVANIINCVKGGIPQPQWDWNNYFINYVAANKPFLTWQPNNRFIGLNDSFFISFLNSLATVPLSLIVDVEYIDGTTDQVITDFTDSNKILYHIQAGPDQLGLNALHADKRLYKYSLSIVSTADHAIIFVEPYTYYIDYRKFYNTKYLHYYNSLGGIEAIRVNGLIETTADVTFTESEKFGGNIIIGQPNSEEYTQTAKSKTDSFKGDSGFIYTAREQDVFQEILLTRFAWERIIGKNWRIYITNKSTSLRKSTDKKWSMALEWRYSFENSVYAPLIDLGAGHDDGNYCIPVNIVGAPSLPDVLTGQDYSASLTLSGDSPITVGTISPAWLHVSISGNTATITGTPVDGDQGTNIPVSIQFLNCSDSVYPFTDSINVTDPIEPSPGDIQLISIEGSQFNGISPNTWYSSLTFPVTDSAIGGHTDFTGDISVQCTVAQDSRIELYINGTINSCNGHIGTGSQTYTLSSITIAATDIVKIVMKAGSNCP